MVVREKELTDKVHLLPLYLSFSYNNGIIFVMGIWILTIFISFSFIFSDFTFIFLTLFSWKDDEEGT